MKTNILATADGLSNQDLLARLEDAACNRIEAARACRRVRR